MNIIDFNESLIDQNCDVIILGAGIAGLLLASELSKTLNVIVIEKENDISIQKYWLTDSGCIYQNEELKELIDTTYSFMDFIDHEIYTYRSHGEYLLWKSEKLIKYLLKKARSLGANILYDTPFYSYKQNKKEISVFAGKYKISGKLVIDCMGYSSTIVSLNNLLNISGYYVMYGAKLSLLKEISPIGLYNIKIGKKAKYIEVFPSSDNYAYVALISTEKQIDKESSISDEFNNIINKTFLNQYFNLNKSYNSLSGIIPVGSLKKRAINRILFYGEAGQVNPAMSATALTKMLYTYKQLSKEISECAIKDQCDSKSLSKLKICNSPFFSKRFQLNGFKTVLNWNSYEFSKFIKELEMLPQNFVNKNIFSELSYKDIMDIDIIKHILKRPIGTISKMLLRVI